MASSSAYSAYQKLANKNGLRIGRKRSSSAKSKTNSKGLPYAGFNAEVGF